MFLSISSLLLFSKLVCFLLFYTFLLILLSLDFFLLLSLGLLLSFVLTLIFHYLFQLLPPCSFLIFICLELGPVKGREVSVARSLFTLRWMFLGINVVRMWRLKVMHINLEILIIIPVEGGRCSVLSKHVQVMRVVVNVMGISVMILPVGMVSISFPLMVKIHIKLNVVFKVTSPAVVASVSNWQMRSSLVVLGLEVLVIDFIMWINRVVGVLLMLREFYKVMFREDMLWHVLNVPMVLSLPVVFDLWSHELGVRQWRLLMSSM